MKKRHPDGNTRRTYNFLKDIFVEENRKIKKIDEQICNNDEIEDAVLLEVTTQEMDFSVMVREKISLIIEIMEIKFETQKIKEDSKSKQTKKTVKSNRNLKF